MERLFESAKIDYVDADTGAGEEFALDDYREAVVIAIGDGDVTVGQLEGADVSVTADDPDASMVAVKAEQVDDEEDGMEVSTEAGVYAVVLRGNARYKAVSLDDLHEYEIV